MLRLTLTVVPLDDGSRYTAGMIVGLLRGAGLHVAGVDAVHEDDIDVELGEFVDEELLDRLHREATHPADHKLIPPRPPLDHEAIRARAVQGL